MFIMSQLWLTSHLRSTVVLLDTGTPSTSREIYSEIADDGTRTQNPSVINRVLQLLKTNYVSETVIPLYITGCRRKYILSQP